MTGFSAEWLALREPADHAARDRDLLAAVAAHLTRHDPVEVLELGCGTGSHLRASAPALGPRQAWRLVDHDPALLEAARERLAAWADQAEEVNGRLRLRKAAATIDVTFTAADLAGGLGSLLAHPPHLVTAAALFDLLSASAIEGLVAELVARRLPFYTVLTYDGTDRWVPPDPNDAAIVAAFHEHMGRDKGFGPAAGPRATDVMARAFEASGYRVRTAPSPWRLGSQEPLAGAFTDGFASAVAETGRVAPEVIAGWRTARAGASVEVGHLDLFASPA